MRKWPYHKDFAFTIIDDTDLSTVENVKPVYDFLIEKGIKSTKTVWVYKSNDNFVGETIQDPHYLDFILDLKNRGFEIAIHNVGSGKFFRQEIIEGYEIFKEKLGSYPKMHINHCGNSDNIYWGYKRYGFILKNIFKLLKGKKRKFYGDEEGSPHFWGDIALKHIDYMRDRVFNGINTLKYDPEMPYKVRSKKYSKFWFSSSDGHTIAEFNNLISKENVDQLKKEKGLCIVYTHLACGFADKDGNVNETFKKNIDYLTKQNGWFVPANEILDYLVEQKKNKSDYINSFYVNYLDFRWMIDRVIKKLKYGR